MKRHDRPEFKAAEDEERKRFVEMKYLINPQAVNMENSPCEFGFFIP
jgi:hypothetical protein